MKRRTRKYLSKKGLLGAVYDCFAEIEDTIAGRDYALTDYLMCGLAVFSLKFPSLLEFDNVFRNQDKPVSRNLRNLFGVSGVPSDSGLRKRLDELNPRRLRGAFKTLFSLVQRGKVLEEYKYMDGHVLLSLDGTGYFSSKTVHCVHCCAKHHRDGSTTYYHQRLCGAMVSPDHKEVIPLAPEPILNTDGATKNDCERNASKRFLEDYRREHPHLKTILLEDGLASNAPHIRQLEQQNLRYILVAKPGDHKFLFGRLDQEAQEWEIREADGTLHQFRYLNDTPLNASNPDVTVNMVEYRETKPATRKRPNPKPMRMSWVTDLPVNEKMLMKMMRAGRARWRIENETFNTLKNHGDHFEHNFGHGYKHLSSVLGALMLLAFAVDQIEMRCDGLFRAAFEKMGRLKYFRERVRNLFREFALESWEFLYRGIAEGFKITVQIDSS